LLLIEGIRVLSITCVFVVTFLFQLRQPEFISTEVLFPIYWLLFIYYSINAIYLFSFEGIFSKLRSATAILFVADALFISGLIYFTGVNQSIFLFMYLVNISLCGFVFQRRGAFFIALLTSILFSLILIVGPEVRGQSLYFAVGLNNLAFFAVAGLSGYLSEQLNFMGASLMIREQELATLQNMNDLIIENISTGLMTVDPQGKVIHANRSAHEILMQKGSFDDRLLSEILPAIAPQLLAREENAGLENTARFEVEYISPREEKLILGFSVSPLKIETGENRGYILIFQDLTQIKRFESQLRRHEKLAAVGQMAAGIAHEIRNPLASISGSVQLMRDMRTKQTEEETKLTAIILREIDRLNNLVSEFLDFVRPDVIVDEEVDLEQLLKDVLEMASLNGKLRQDVRQVVDLQTHQKILGNTNKLKQVFLNLVINAYQAMQESTEPILSISLQMKVDQVIVKIKDTGGGMGPAVLNRLFEPFHTTKSQGTGLGLATVHKILENHEAQIHVDSKVGQGTEFTVEFSRLVGLTSPAQDLAKTFNDELKRFNLRKKG
jgi:two-component system sensor histidine kinase PilS (NtrC family)